MWIIISLLCVALLINAAVLWAACALAGQDE